MPALQPNPGSLFIIAGPCVVESERLCLTVADRLASLAKKHRLPIVFKASYDKANRTSQASFRGLGKDEGLRVLEMVGRKSGLPVLTDIHVPDDARDAAAVADVLQVPAFLCRQTDLLIAAAKTGKIVNVKKGQFMAPHDMKYSLEKAGKRTWLTERGTFFGYNRLVVDFASAPVLKGLGRPIVFDATHSVQMPGGGGGASSGDRAMAIPLARAALGVGFDGLFFEVHPNPDKALCDGPNSISLNDFAHALPKLIELHKSISRW
jgi:2-dehydro-3-deoxyphosphooctonate aldolase (KDO 8-P synthase)